MERIRTKTSILENHDGLTMVRIEEKCYTTTVKEFLTEVEGIISRIPANFEEGRVANSQAVLEPFLKGLNNEESHSNQAALYNFGIALEKHSRFKECLDSFVNSLPGNSEHHLNDIIVHSYMCEFVTSFAVDNQVAIAVEVLLFVEIYPFIKQTGGIKFIIQNYS